MNHKQRVVISLSHHRPDRVPHHISFTVSARQRMAEYLGDRDFEAHLDNSLSVISLRKAAPWRQVKSAVWEDEFGVQWDRSIDRDIGVVCNRVVTPDNLKEYRFPDPALPSRYEPLIKAVETDRDRFVVANFGFSLFERAWTLAGMEEVLMNMVAQPAFVHDLLDRILAYNTQVIDRLCTYDIDAVLFGDDWGQQTGLLMGLERWREFILPRIRVMYQQVKSAGKAVMCHSCGKVQELLPDLIDAGLDVFNPFQPEVMDVYETKRQFGSLLSFYGGISIQRTLPYATPQQVKDEVRRLLDEIGRDGGYIAAPSHAIMGDAKPENIMAMIETLALQ
jgi:uroporphyrinogen decarboxylase